MSLSLSYPHYFYLCSLVPHRPFKFLHFLLPHHQSHHLRQDHRTLLPCLAQCLYAPPRQFSQPFSSPPPCLGLPSLRGFLAHDCHDSPLSPALFLLTLLLAPFLGYHIFPCHAHAPGCVINKPLIHVSCSSPFRSIPLALPTSCLQGCASLLAHYPP